MMCFFSFINDHLLMTYRRYLCSLAVRQYVFIAASPNPFLLSFASFPQISHVFNLDLPMDGEGYVHRGGRAGRLGRPGKIISIVTPSQEFAVRRLGNGICVDIKRISLGTKPLSNRNDVPIVDAGVLNIDAVEDK